MCRVFPPGFNPQTGPDAVPGKWPHLFRGVRNVNIAKKYPTGNERGPLVSRATAAMAVADSLSDRLAVASGGLINITLSAQQLLACADWPQHNIQAPNYGAPNDLTNILEYAATVGLVPESCWQVNPLCCRHYVNSRGLIRVPHPGRNGTGGCGITTISVL